MKSCVFCGRSADDGCSYCGNGYLDEFYSLNNLSDAKGLNELNELNGPYYYGVLANGDVRYFNKKPNRPFFVEEYTVLVEFQHKWHFLKTNKGKLCDYESCCGYDRGPGFDKLIKRLKKGE